MPIYEYRCTDCNTRFDKLFLNIKKIPKKIICPSCEGIEVKRIISAPTIHSGEGGVDMEALQSIEPEKKVFGRKELKAAEEKKRQIKEEALYGD
ncbi:zinc ribbon domain-containing protein [Anaerolineales bacterium HSG6]|nr:zinc ribbon domain-containing protein [Anaerolineales bacterium HSG6]MDM8529543.1 zinc ribbon domain-containing protein [Anaerolineales bacterium HSG25]